MEAQVKKKKKVGGKKRKKKGAEGEFGEREEERRGRGAGGSGEGRIEESREERGSIELTFDTQEVQDAAWISFVSL